MAHVLLHTSEGDFTDTEQTPRNLREVEAESVALLCCEALNLEGATTAEVISKLAVSGNRLRRLRDPRKERTKNLPRRRSNSESGTTDERAISRIRELDNHEKGKGQESARTLPDPPHQLFNRDRRKIDATKH